MATYNKFNQFVEYMAEQVVNLGSDTLKVALTNTQPAVTNTILANITQIANGNGYTTGGTAATQSSSAQSSGTYKLVVGDVVFTAASGDIGPFRYAVLYDDTPSSPADPLIAWWDYGAPITVVDGETFTVDFNATDGVLQLT
jgi:hypothetical protein